MPQRIKSLYKAFYHYADMLEYYPAIIKFKQYGNVEIYREDITIKWTSHCKGSQIRHINYFCSDLAEELDRYTTRYLKYT